ncbi:MAG: four helix bundle protein [Patescibacteria group bacterium]
MFRFEQLEIWKHAIAYAKLGYKVVESLPKTEEFSLKSQMKRAYVSVPSNIAEGSGSVTTKGFCNYLDISIKSTLETVSQALFAKELTYLNQNQVSELYGEAEHLIRRIRSFKRALNKK